MSTRIICDIPSCDGEAQVCAVRINGSTRDIDLCDEHRAPLAEAWNTGRSALISVPPHVTVPAHPYPRGPLVTY